MDESLRLHVVFYKSESGNEPVRDWLKELDRADRRTIGEDIKTFQFGWPLGLPLVRKLDDGLWEVRTRLNHRIARVIFTVHEDAMVLLHGFIKKTQKAPLSDLKVARQRLRQIRDEEQ